MTFEDLNLNNPLRNALADLEYVNPTPIQVAAFPVVMSGKDVVGVAQTGTGKTFAYLLPLLRLMKFSTDGHPRIVILVPTRELVVQVVEEVKTHFQKLAFKTIITRNVRLSEAPSFGEAIIMYDAASKGAINYLNSNYFH